MDIDAQTAAAATFGAGGTVGLTYLGYLLYLMRKLKRTDKKEGTVEDSWIGIVTALNGELSRLHLTIKDMNQEIGGLTVKVNACEAEKASLRIEMEAFKRSIGTRVEGGAP